MAEDLTTLTNVSPLLSDEALNQALTDWFKQLVSFSHWEHISGTGKGDSYLSEVKRIKIHGKTQNGDPKHVQVILKCLPKSVARRLTFRNDEYFRNEVQFYNKVLPVMIEFQASKNVTELFDKYAKLFLACTDGNHDVVCLEDASLENFGSAVRQECIDYDHCKLCFKALAQFHALSFAMKDQEPEKFDQIQKEIFETFIDERLWEFYGRFWKRISGIAIDAVEKEYPNSVYLEKIKQFCVPERFTDMIDAVTSTLSTGTISHGDCWTNNFLFKYESDKVKDAKIIDFQLTRCATPVLDLSFMIYACTSQELRLQHYDELLKYYHGVLSTQIREMGSNPEKVYSWDLFLSEIKKYSFFGLAMSLVSTPIIVLAPEDAPNVDLEGDQQINLDDIWQHLVPFKTKEGRLREANNVVHCVDNGYI